MTTACPKFTERDYAEYQRELMDRIIESLGIPAALVNGESSAYTGRNVPAQQFYGRSMIRGAYDAFVNGRALGRFGERPMADPMPTPSEPEWLSDIYVHHHRLDRAGATIEHDAANRRRLLYLEPRHRHPCAEAIDISRDETAAGLLRAWGDSPFDVGLKNIFADRLDELGHGQAAERVRRFDSGQLLHWSKTQDPKRSLTKLGPMNAWTGERRMEQDPKWWYADWQRNLAALFGLEYQP